MKQLQHFKKRFFLGVFMLLSMAIQAQNFTVTGTVTNLNGLPLPNVPVYTFDSSMVAGTPNPVFYSTTTDNVGYYSQVIPNGAAPGPNIIFITGLVDCSSSFIYSSFSNNQGTTNSAVADFSICDTTSIIVSPVCSAQFFSFPDTIPNNMSFLAPNVSFGGTGTYLWDFGDGTTSTQATPTHNFANPGGASTYNVCLTYTDAAINCTDSYCEPTFIDSNYWFGCNAQFISFPTWNGVPNSVDFYNASASAINTTYNWDFGDGTTYTGATPTTHTYPAAGSYYACLTATNPTGCVSTFCDSVRTTTIVVTPTCQAYFYAYPDTSTLPNSYRFVDMSANWGIPANYTYSWDFGDGSTSTLQNPTHQYASSTASYNVCLTITDSASNCNNTYCEQISMQNSPCANLYITQQVTGNTIAFGTATTSTTATYNWDFGDGTTSTQPAPVHTYTNVPPGAIFLVRLDVSDSVNNCSAVAYSNVYFFPPCSNTYIIQNTIPGSNTVSFTTNSANSLGFSFAWDFGDGSPISTQDTAIHTYTNPNPTGFYHVQLTFTDSMNNCTSITSTGVFLQQSVNCQPSYSVAPNGLSVTFIDNSYTNTGTPAANYLWDFGDGNVSTQTGTVTHQYAQAGTYTVCLSLNDATINCSNQLCAAVGVGSIGGGGSLAIGIVMADSIPTPNATVYLIAYDSLLNTMTVVDTMNTNSSGIFYFMPQATATYYIKAAPLAGTALFNTHMPTYYGDVVNWQNAIAYNPLNGVLLATINLVPVVLRPGAGNLWGNVANAGYMPAGHSMAGLSVILMNTNGGITTACKHTLTNANGSFSLPSLDYGSYKAMVEIPGMPSAQYNVNITAANPNTNNLNFVATNNNIALANAEQELLSASLGILPNPNNGVFVLNFDATAANNAQIRIFDALGRLVLEQNAQFFEGSNKLPLQLNNVQEGVYLVQLKTNNATAQVRFVKTN